MSGPQEPPPAARDRLRAARADREQVIEALKDAFVRGCLTRDELGARAGQALSARTYAELAAVTAAIPASPAPASPAPASPAPAGSARPLAPTLHLPLARAVVWSASCVVIAFVAVLVSVWLGDDPLNPRPLAGLEPMFLTVAVAAVFAAGLFLVAGVTNSVEQRCSRRPAPPRAPVAAPAPPVPAPRAVPGLRNHGNAPSSWL
jgi:hypothetical protein